MKNNTRLLMCGVILTAALFGAGCAPAAPSTPSAPATGGSKSDSKPTLSAFDTEGKFTIDPCALITPADAETILGGPLVLPIRAGLTDPDSASCTYYTDRSKGPSRELIIMVQESQNTLKSNYQKNAKDFFEYNRTVFNPDAETIPNLGDEAIWTFRSINVLKGDVVLDVHVEGFDEDLDALDDSGPNDRKAMLEAASLAVSRLN